jgi:4-hydroxybenzoate polyprenyltransferase
MTDSENTNPPPLTVRGRHTILDYIFLTRPVLFPPVWTIALLGTVAAGLLTIPWWRWALLLIQQACVVGAVYVVNQIFDVESDRANRKLFFLSEGIITIRSAWVFTVVLNFTALAIAAYFGTAYLALTIAGVILGVAYSAGPHAWKNLPLMGLLANVIGHGFIVHASGIAFAQGSIQAHWIRSLAYGLAVGGVYLATTVADVPGDRRSGKRTLAVALGGKSTMQLATVLVVAAIALSLWQGDWYLSIAGLCALPVFFWPALTGGDHWAPRAAKAAVAALTIAAAVSYPWYLVVLLAGFFGTRLFFRWRFDLSYPTFS